jgi:GNAT superfamily N-acetyltransferase
VIRPARQDHVPAICRLVRELAEYEREPAQAKATERQIHEALFGDAATAFALIAEHPGPDGPETAGFALWFLNFSTWTGRAGLYLEDLFVRPRFRGLGYGRDLLVELARICVERGYARFEWSVLDWNEPAIGFYRSLGAVPLDAWTTYRLSGEALARLAAAEGGGRGP